MKKVVFISLFCILIFSQKSFANSKIYIDKKDNKIIFVNSDPDSFEEKDVFIFQDGKLFDLYKLNELVASFNNELSLLSAGNSSDINVYKINNGNIFSNLQIINNNGQFSFEQAYSMAFSSNSKFLANGNSYNEVRIWDIAKKKLINTLSGHKGNRVSSVCFSNDNKTIISGDSKGEIKIWYFKKENDFSNYSLRSLSDHNNSPISNLIISPNGKLLASSSVDGTINIWSIKTGIKISSEKIESKSYIDLSFSPDNNLLASSNEKGKIIIWDMKPFYEIESVKKEKYLKFLVRNTFNSNIAPNNQLLNEDIILSVDENNFESSKDFINKIENQGNYMLKVNRNNTLIDIFLNKITGFDNFKFSVIGEEISFKKVFELQAYEGITFTSNSKYLISAGSTLENQSEAKILIFNLSKKEEIAYMNIITKGENRGDWVIITNDYMFDGSINGLKTLTNVNSANFKQGLLNSLFTLY